MKLNLKSFLSFERMITPIIIKILFWLGLIGSVVSGIVIFFSAFTTGIRDGRFLAIVGGFLLGLIGGVLVALLGALTARIYAELLILAFRINETLTDIKQIIEQKSDL